MSSTIRKTRNGYALVRKREKYAERRAPGVPLRCPCGRRATLELHRAPYAHCSLCDDIERGAWQRREERMKRAAVRDGLTSAEFAERFGLDASDAWAWFVRHGLEPAPSDLPKGLPA